MSGKDMRTLMEAVKLTESMDLAPVKYNEENEYWSSVFPDEWSSYYDWDNHPHTSQDEPPKNPDYKPEYNMNLSNRNMRWFMDELDLQSDEGFHIEIDEFLGKASSWMQKNLNKPSMEVPIDINTNEVPAAKNINYDLLRKRLINELPKDHDVMFDISHDWASEKLGYVKPNATKDEIKAAYQDYIRASIERIADNRIRQQKNKDEQSVKTGPTMIDMGVPENYFNENMIRAIKIAQKGKELGATHIAAY